MAAKTIISIHANAPGVGKTTLAKALAREYAENRRPVLLISFADKLREAAVECLVEMGTCYKSDAKLYVTTDKDDKTCPLAQALLCNGREFLKAFGQSCRYLDEDCFVKPVLAAIDNMPDNGVVIIDDCRQQNEYDALVAREALFVKLNGNSYTGAEGNMEDLIKGLSAAYGVFNHSSPENNARSLRKSIDDYDKEFPQ